MKNNWPVEKINFIWRKKYKQTFIIVGIVGTPILYFLCASISDYLLFYTLVVIFWYSRETMDLKQIANKQTQHLRIEHKTNLRPYLRLQKGGMRGLILVNEGKGVAVNLKSEYKGYGVTREFLKIPAMAAAPQSKTESFVPQNSDLDLDPSVTEFTIEITYNDIENRNYRA